MPRAAPTRSPRPTGGWLADLADDTPVARLSLPGTQHSAVRFGGDQVARQRLTIAEQLDLGIRFLDIGCRSSHSAFAVHHGAVFQRVLFGEVLLACEAFLRARPSETVRLRLRQEHSAVPDAEFRRVFDLYLAGFRRLLRLDATLPTLSQARGRVVLLADHPGLPGVPYGDAALFDVQDDATATPAVKYQKVERHLHKAAARPGKLYVNYVGTAVQGSPRANARYLNPRVHRFLTGPVRPPAERARRGGPGLPRGHAGARAHDHPAQPAGRHDRRRRVAPPGRGGPRAAGPTSRRAPRRGGGPRGHTCTRDAPRAVGRGQRRTFVEPVRSPYVLHR